MAKENKIKLLFSDPPDFMYTLEFTFLYIAVRICLKIRGLLR